MRIIIRLFLYYNAVYASAGLYNIVNYACSALLLSLRFNDFTMPTKCLFNRSSVDRWVGHHFTDTTRNRPSWSLATWKKVPRNSPHTLAQKFPSSLEKQLITQLRRLSPISVRYTFKRSSWAILQHPLRNHGFTWRGSHVLFSTSRALLRARCFEWVWRYFFSFHTGEQW